VTELLTLPLDALTRSPLNPRQIVDADAIAALAESIRVCGLIQNLCGLRTEAGVQIVAGGRRLSALRLLADRGDPVPPVPVLVTNDPAQARDWAGAENTARADLHPADEIRHFAALLAQGMAPTAIAAAFGVPERRVAQRLKLAALPETALTALRENRITLDQAAALTLARGDAKSVETLIDYATQRGTTAAELRGTILRETVRASRDRRAMFVGLDVYEAAGGTLTRDLFSDEAVIEDVALLDRLATEKIDAARAILMEQGWGWIIPHPETQFAWTFSGKLTYSLTAPGNLKKPLRKLVGGWMIVNQFGNVETKLGWISAADEPAAREAGLLPPLPAAAAPSADGEPDEPTGFSAALLADLRAIRHHALVAALIAQPGCGNALLAWALVHPNRAKIIDATIKDGPLAPQIIEGFTPNDLDDPTPEDAPDYHNRDHAEEAITVPLLRALRYGFSWTGNDPDLMEVYAQAESITGARMRSHWVPTQANFFSRVPSGYLDQVYNEVLGFVQTDEAAREFSRLKKSEKSQVLHSLFNDSAARGYRHMTPAAQDRIARWAPKFN